VDSNTRHIIDAPAIHLQVFFVSIEGNGNRKHATVSSGRYLDALRHLFARLILRLVKIQDFDAVRIAHVVGSAERLQAVLLIAKVVSGPPGTGPILEAPVTEV
jgi:hypothetical protein